MSSSTTVTHFTMIFPKRANIAGSPEQAFRVLENHDKYYKYLIGGISGGTITAIGLFINGDPLPRNPHILCPLIQLVKELMDLPERIGLLHLLL